VPEENKTAEQVTLTEEQVQAKIKEIQAAIASFTSDPRHERYKLCPENKKAIADYLESHSLELTADSLHTAFVELSKEPGKLLLYEESKLQAPETSKAKVEGEIPPIGVATGEDLGIGLTGQQQARRNAPIAGVSRSSNRDAFIRTAQNSAVKVQGGRLHL
jgi:hypothetical protein